MDTHMEDKMYRQIEKNLSNNINENLFSTGNLYEKEEQPVRSLAVANHPYPEKKQEMQPYAQEWDIYENHNQPAITRAEYIRQAREACLRQLSITQNEGRVYDSYYQEAGETQGEQEKKKAKAMKLFHEETGHKKAADADATPQEIASFRFLVIRMVCAIVLFVSVFIIDKLELKFGGFSYDLIRQYITTKDSLVGLQNWIVTWLK